MNMKKNKYTIINNPLDDYDFSFRRCHAAEIGAYIIGIMIFLLICALFVCSEENERKWKALRECFYIPIVFSVPLFLLGLSMTLRIRRLKKIIENGKMTDGEVISYRRIHVNRGKRNRLLKETPNYTILNIRFYDDGNQECAVGVGHKIPEKVFASTYCTVYIFNNNVFVTDFSMRKKGEPQIAFELKK